MKYPLSYRQSFQEEDIEKEVTINHAGHIIPLELRFEPYQSLLLNIDSQGRWKFEDIEFIPKPPVRKIPNR